MPSQDCVWCNDGCQLAPSFAIDSVSLYGKHSPLVVVEQQALLSEWLEQGVNLCVLEFDDLLLALVREAAETGQQEVP